MQLAGLGGKRPYIEAQTLQDLAQMEQRDPAQAAVAVEQHLFDRVAGEGEAVAVGQALEANQSAIEGGVAAFAQGWQLQAAAAQAQFTGIDWIGELLGITGLLPEGCRRPVAVARLCGVGCGERRGLPREPLV